MSWIQRNLFSSWPSALATLLILWLAWKLLPPFFGWAFVDAVWRAPDAAPCREVAGEGACWAFITEKHRFILFGTYPFEQHWRPTAATLILTLLLATFGIALAFPLSIVLALGRRSQLPVVRMACVAYIELIRGVPLISVLFMASVMLPLFLPSGMTIDKLLRAQIAIILFAAAYLAEVVRGGLQAVPRHQYDSAEALGLGYWKRTVFVILPQALRVSIPPLVNTFIGLFKDTSLVLIIGLFDLLSTIKVSLQDPLWSGFGVEAYVFASLVYFAFCWAMSRYSQNLERDLSHGNPGGGPARLLRES